MINLTSENFFFISLLNYFGLSLVASFMQSFELIKILGLLVELKTVFKFNQELESQDLIEQAQHHYIKGGDWKTAVNMFRQRVSFYYLLNSIC